MKSQDEAREIAELTALVIDKRDRAAARRLLLALKGSDHVICAEAAVMTTVLAGRGEDVSALGNAGLPTDSTAAWLCLASYYWGGGVGSGVVREPSCGWDALRSIPGEMAAPLGEHAALLGWRQPTQEERRATTQKVAIKLRVRVLCASSAGRPAFVLWSLCDELAVEGSGTLRRDCDVCLATPEHLDASLRDRCSRSLDADQIEALFEHLERSLEHIDGWRRSSLMQSTLRRSNAS